MAFINPTGRGVATEQVSDTSISINPSANINAGRVITAHCSTDNDSSAVADGASNRHSSVADSKGNTWNKIIEYTDSDGAAADGVTHSIWYSVVTTQILTTDTITLTVASAVTDKIIALVEVTKGANSTIGVGTVGVGQSAISASVSSMINRQYFLLGSGASEGTDSTKTNDADYTENIDARTNSTGNAICSHVVNRIAFLTADTCTSSAWTNTNPIFFLVPFYEIFPDVDTISDNFDDNSVLASLWDTHNLLSGAVTESSQRINATPANSTIGSQGGLISDNFYNLVSSSMQMQVVQIADATNCYTNFEFWYDANNSVGIAFGGGLFEFIQTVGGSFSVPFTVAYDSAVHKYWRLRESGGWIYADYSVDGITWVNFYGAAAPISLYQGRVRFYAYEHTSDATPGSAQFDNFNILTSGTAIDNLTDNFNDNSIDTAKWTSYTESSGVVSETNQELQYDLANATDGSWAGLYSKVQYNLTGKRVSVKIPASTGTGHSWFDLTLSMEQMGIVDNFFSIGINFEDQTIEAVYELGGDDFVITTDPYTNTQDLYISIREDSGTIYWEYSTDGMNWTLLHSQAPFPEIPITNLYVVLDDYEFDATTNPNVHKFDDFNILPSSAIKTALGLARASVKTVQGLAIASVKSYEGLQ